jgi:hypothetical protein
VPVLLELESVQWTPPPLFIFNLIARETETPPWRNLENNALSSSLLKLLWNQLLGRGEEYSTFCPYAGNIFALKHWTKFKKMGNIYKICYVCRSRNYFQIFSGWGTFCWSEVWVVDFHNITLPSAPAARAADSGTASGRTPRGGPSPGHLLASSLNVAAPPSARLTPLTPLVARTALVCRQLSG